MGIPLKPTGTLWDSLERFLGFEVRAGIREGGSVPTSARSGFRV